MNSLKILFISLSFLTLLQSAEESNVTEERGFSVFVMNWQGSLVFGVGWILQPVKIITLHSTSP